MTSYTIHERYENAYYYKKEKNIINKTDSERLQNPKDDKVEENQQPKHLSLNAEIS